MQRHGVAAPEWLFTRGGGGSATKGGRKGVTVTDGRYVTTVDITAAWEAERVVLSLGGEVDFSNASYLDDYLALVVAQGQHNIVVDLRRLEFIDSAGMKVLASTAQRVAPTGRVMLRTVPPVVRTMLSILRLHDLLVVDGRGEPAVS